MEPSKKLTRVKIVNVNDAVVADFYVGLGDTPLHFDVVLAQGDYAAVDVHVDTFTLPVRQPTYKIGDRFREPEGDYEYLLAAVGKKQVALINLETGTRFADPIDVTDLRAVTASEFELACEGWEMELLPADRD